MERRYAAAWKYPAELAKFSEMIDVRNAKQGNDLKMKTFKTLGLSMSL